MKMEKPHSHTKNIPMYSMVLSGSRYPHRIPFFPHKEIKHVRSILGLSSNDLTRII